MKNKLIQKMVIDAMFIAIIVTMSFTPFLGYVNVGVVSISLIHIPVLIGAALLGYKRGLLYGTIYGVCSWIIAMTSASSVLDVYFIYPWISILPRMIFGLASGLLFEIIKRFPKMYQKGLWISFISALSSGFHTFLVLGILWLIYSGPIQVSQGAMNFFTFLSLVVGINGFIEMGIAFVIVPIVVLTLRKALPNVFANK